MCAMSVRRIHRVIGLVMLLPLVGWAVTGAIFFIKPGYTSAYAQLPLKTYAIERLVSITPPSGWSEIRLVRSALGDHVLARTSTGWVQVDPATLAPRPAPSADQVRQLIEDAFAANPARYGKVTSLDG